MKTFLMHLFTPLCVVFLLLVAALILWRKKRCAPLLVLLAAIFLWFGSTDAAGRLLSAGLIAQVDYASYRDIGAEGTDMIVVLTGGSHFMGEIGWLPSQESYRRGAVALNLQTRIGSRVPLLISGGHVNGSRHPSEAAILKAQFHTLRSEVTPVYLEEASTDTYESALQVAHQVKSRNAEKFFLVTSELHMPRALATYKGRGLNPVPFPVFSLERRPLHLKDFFPSARGAENVRNALYEWVGIVQYMLTERIRWEDL